MFFFYPQATCLTVKPPSFLTRVKDQCFVTAAKMIIILYKIKYSNHIKKSMWDDLLAERDVKTTFKYLREELWHKTSFDKNHVPTLKCIEYRTLNIMCYIHLHRQCNHIQATKLQSQKCGLGIKIWSVQKPVIKNVKTQSYNVGGKITLSSVPRKLFIPFLHIFIH